MQGAIINSTIHNQNTCPQFQTLSQLLIYPDFAKRLSSPTTTISYWVSKCKVNDDPMLKKIFAQYFVIAINDHLLNSFLCKINHNYSIHDIFNPRDLENIVGIIDFYFAFLRSTRLHLLLTLLSSTDFPITHSQSVYFAHWRQGNLGFVQFN